MQWKKNDQEPKNRVIKKYLFTYTCKCVYVHVYNKRNGKKSNFHIVIRVRRCGTKVLIIKILLLKYVISR